ncbi:MAG: response regulator, partial [Candidatus Riflebacteria bacterium]|nr:response regulator [Candidatus Riflebacteria bacterium]
MNSLSNQDIKRMVLVVDDEFVNREMLGFIIKRDYNVINAKNGKEALELIRKHKTILSLVLLDLLMPVMDGFTVLKELQNDQELNKIPVIVLTSEKSAEIESLRLGAVDFITKPYDMPEVILARVRRSIELSEGSKMIQNTSHDETTGLLSKDFFFQFCERYDKYYPDEKMDAVAFNINHLSLINEINGRSAGTEIIKKIADAIKVLLNRATGMACRFSDTFYLYMEHNDNCEDIL